MNKLILIIFSILLCISTAQAVTTVDELVDLCHKDPLEISIWIATQIKYEDDWIVWRMEDYWQTPTETLRLKTGDCEDYAILAYASLKKLGFYPKLFVLYNNDTAHAICLFRYKHAWYYLGEELLTRVKVLTYMGIVRSYNIENNTKYTYYYFLKEKEFRLE